VSGRAVAIAALSMAAAGTADAHFLMLILSTDRVDAPSAAEVQLELTFTHPLQGGPAMPLERPVRVAVASETGTLELTDRLEPRTVDGEPAWAASFDAAEPADYIAYAEPVPYWEPSEGKFIVHYPKVVVDAFGWGQGWDRLVGLPVEIEPLVRPYGLWVGNLFRGIVRRDGRPVPFAEVEVEWVNDGSLATPGRSLETQVIKADAGGAFAYAMPRAGWWGFAALMEADRPMRAPDGRDVPVELGALMWVRAEPME
jgi:cobalt/nickel transport protein